MANYAGTPVPANFVEPVVGPHSTFMFHDPITDHVAEFASFSSNRSKLSLRPSNTSDMRNMISGNRARDLLLAVSHDVKSATSPTGTETQFRSHPAKLQPSSSEKKLMVAGEMMKTEPEVKFQPSHQLREVTMKPSTALQRIRTVATLHEPQGNDSTEVFLNGRNVINRLMQDTIKANQQAHRLANLRDRAEEQRAESLFRATLRQKERLMLAEEIVQKRKMMRTRSEKDIKRNMTIESNIRERLKTSVKEKRVQPRSLLILNTFDPGKLPPPQEHIFTLNDLQALLTTVKPKRFRFK